MLYNSQEGLGCLVPVQVCPLTDSFFMGNPNVLQTRSRWFGFDLEGASRRLRRLLMSSFMGLLQHLPEIKIQQLAGSFVG